MKNFPSERARASRAMMHEKCTLMPLKCTHFKDLKGSAI